MRGSYSNRDDLRIPRSSGTGAKVGRDDVPIGANGPPFPCGARGADPRGGPVVNWGQR